MGYRSCQLSLSNLPRPTVNTDLLESAISNEERLSGDRGVNVLQAGSVQERDHIALMIAQTAGSIFQVAELITCLYWSWRILRAAGGKRDFAKLPSGVVEILGGGTSVSALLIDGIDD